jgi:hypothetical protein
VGRDVLRVKWKKELLNQPFLCDVKSISEGVRILKEKAFLYTKYRDIFVRLGRVAGFENLLELYQLRRASGRNINCKSALSARRSYFARAYRIHQALLTR